MRRDLLAVFGTSTVKLSAVDAAKGDLVVLSQLLRDHLSVIIHDLLDMHYLLQPAVHFQQFLVKLLSHHLEVSHKVSYFFVTRLVKLA